MTHPSSGSLRGRLSRIGLGCGTFGREIDQQTSFTIMDRAWANQITHFDSSEAYGRPGGASESIIGAWLALRRPKVGSMILATKMIPPYAPGEVEGKVEGSLKRLGVDAVDLYYFHGWDETAADPAVLQALDRLVKSGKIRAIGASNFNQEQLARVLGIQTKNGWARIKALQNNNSFAVSHIGPGYLAFCAKEDVAVVTYSPLGAGFLTGKHKVTVEKGSRFDIVPAHQDIYFTDPSRARLARLEELSAKSGQSLVALALSWALHRPGVDSVLVGGRSPSHIDQAIAAMRIDANRIFTGPGDLDFAPPAG